MSLIIRKIDLPVGEGDDMDEPERGPEDEEDDGEPVHGVEDGAHRLREQPRLPRRHCTLCTANGLSHVLLSMQ